MKYVLFDLDSTLYTDDTGLFQALGVRLEAWVAQALGISLEASKALRREYFLAYGLDMEIVSQGRFIRQEILSPTDSRWINPMGKIFDISIDFDY